jgi:tRNA pseudouridine38-40 synthase
MKWKEKIKLKKRNWKNMANYKILLQYEGTRYQGWQKQESSESTIQGKLEAVLGKMTGETVEVQGSGRTDAGVHAYGQVASFHLSTTKTPGQIQEYMNQYLPEDIGVIAIRKVPERFHARLHAKGKKYQYRIINSTTPHVFDRRYCYVYPDKLDMDAMKEAASYLIGTQDFKAFTSTKKGKKSTSRTIHSIDFEKIKDEIQITFYGDGFLYHMIRIVVGTLLEVGAGVRTAESVKDTIRSLSRDQAGPLAPALGLSLLEVFYEENEQI